MPADVAELLVGLLLNQISDGIITLLIIKSFVVFLLLSLPSTIKAGAGL